MRRISRMRCEPRTGSSLEALLLAVQGCEAGSSATGRAAQRGAVREATRDGHPGDVSITEASPTPVDTCPILAETAPT